MKINTLRLTNFRNHKKLSLSFDGDQVLIIGPNGSGKSNILEAIHLLSTTKSLRTKYEREMISHEKKFATVLAEADIDYEKYEIELQIIQSELFENSSNKKCKINKVSKSQQKFAGTLTSVLFAPPDIELFIGSPARRRKYIDSIFFQVDLEYKRAHSQYIKTVRQRNKLLELIRDKNKGFNQIEFWNEKLLKSGELIQKKRSELFDHFSKKIVDYATMLNGKDFKYSIEYKKNLISKARMDQYWEKELAAKTTLIGPHRDDFKIDIDGLEIAYFGSRGQQRATLLALKLCEIDYLTEKTGKRPILLLDDIFSELDENHKQAVLKIMDLQQTIITSAYSVDALKEFANEMKVFDLNKM